MSQSEPLEQIRESPYSCGFVVLDSLQSDRLKDRNRQYDVLLIGAGRVKMADGSDSKWLIPPQALRESVHLFTGAASYVDHPEMFGFGWHQRPSVRDLVGVVLDPEWSEQEQGITATLKLYDQDPDSAGAMLGALYDQILADRQAGTETPKIGLSAVLWHESHLDEETGLRITDRITQVDSVDHVYSAGARGYVREALSRLASVASRTSVRDGAALSRIAKKSYLDSGENGG